MVRCTLMLLPHLSLCLFVPSFLLSQLRKLKDSMRDILNHVQSLQIKIERVKTNKAKVCVWYMCVCVCV